MRYAAFIIFIVLLNSGCETELVINTNTPSIPVAYAVFNSADTVHYVRLTKTFRTDYNVYDKIIPQDSMNVPNAVVRIERWNSGYFVDEVRLDLLDHLNRDSGLFPRDAATVFELKKNPGNSVYFNVNQTELFRLIIEIPYKPIVYSEYHLIKPLIMTTPRSDGRVFNMFDFHVIFTSYAYFTEMFVRLHFLNNYQDCTSTETAIWREFQDHEIIDGKTGKNYSVPLEGNAFFERIGNVIPRDEKVITREFEFAELLFNCHDENIYQYNESMKILPSDQAGSPFTNVVNGKGIVGSRYTWRASILFDHGSLEELCKGKYTKHLKFVDW